MACTGHVNSCPAHSGYVPPRTITFTNVAVAAGDVVNLEDEVSQLLSELNAEAVRRSSLGKTPISLTLSPYIKESEARQIRDLFLSITDTVAVSPYTNTEIAKGSYLKATTYEVMKNSLISDTSSCPCNCNYACTCVCNYACTCNCNYACTCVCNYCTCNCNYCPCNCNYCTCNCNYCTCNCNHCGCNCNYSCKCNCNYACTCNCNYACKCNCNYSDIRLKTEITYF